MNRELQLEILKFLDEGYPELFMVKELPGKDPDRLKEAYYLIDHGLIDASIGKGTIGSRLPGRINSVRLNARGRDFLQDDGGLSSILGVLTVKLHDSTIRSLLLEGVNQSAANPEEKQSLTLKIKNATSTAITQALQDMAKEGIKKIPEAVPMLFNLLG